MPDEPATTIRWVWGYDRDGKRITEAEAVAYVCCERCRTVHAHPLASRVPLRLDMLPGRSSLEVVGQATSEFYPDG